MNNTIETKPNYYDELKDTELFKAILKYMVESNDCSLQSIQRKFVLNAIQALKYRSAIRYHLSIAGGNQ